MKIKSSLMILLLLSSNNLMADKANTIKEPNLKAKVKLIVPGSTSISTGVEGVNNQKNPITAEAITVMELSPKQDTDGCSYADYTKQNRDALASGMDPIKHYNLFGKQAGACNPNQKNPENDIAKDIAAFSTSSSKDKESKEAKNEISNDPIVIIPEAGNTNAPRVFRPDGGIPTNPNPVGYPRDFNINNVIWLTFPMNVNMSTWKVTSEITEIKVETSQICIDHTKKGKWPTIDLGEETIVEGNPWVIVKINGKWYGGTYEWLRPGQICKFVGSTNAVGRIGPHAKIPPLKTWYPRRGEYVGFMVSSLARMGPQPKGSAAKERTDVKFFQMQ